MTRRDLKIAAYADRLRTLAPELSVTEACEWAEALIVWREREAMASSWERWLAELPVVELQ